MEHPVPIEFTEDLPPQRLCMKGTNQTKIKCEALIGQVGTSVICKIYLNRPSPCREFGVHIFNGQIIASREEIGRCNQARAAWNLPPIFAEEHQEGKEKIISLLLEGPGFQIEIDG